MTRGQVGNDGFANVVMKKSLAVNTFFSFSYVHFLRAAVLGQECFIEMKNTTASLNYTSCIVA